MPHDAPPNDSPILFRGGAENAPAPDAPRAGCSGAWKVLIADDEQDVHEVTEIALRDFGFDGKGLAFLHAHSGAEALELFGVHPDIAVALIDVVMETDDAGLRLVREIRERLGNRFVRLILRTGQPGAAPERQVITQYDINDYKSKPELSSLKLYSAMMSALRGYRDILALEQARRGMERMLEAATALHQARSAARFAEVALEQLLLLLGVEPRELEEGRCGALYAVGAAAERPAGEVLCAAGKFKSLRRTVLRDSAPHLERALAAAEAGAAGGTALALRLQSRYDEHYHLYAERERPLGALERSLAELFRLKAEAALDNLLLLEKNQVAQRQAIRALARVGEYRRAYFPAEEGAVPAAAGDAAPVPQETMGVEFVEFMQQLAIQAEVWEWGASGAPGHVQRMGRHAARLARLVEMSDEYCEAIGRAAELHDVGKVFVAPPAPGGWYEADPASREEAGRHALWGWEFLRGAGRGASLATQLAAQIALSHHEAWNGSGYPHGIAGEAIPLAARIVAIVDFFDTCTRMHAEGGSEPLPEPEVFDLIAAAAGFYFDPRLARAFLKNRQGFSFSPER